MNGLKDILSVMMADEAINESTQEETIMNMIVAQYFKSQRESESKLMALQHDMELMKLQAEDIENLKFDLEMLQDEKNFLEQEIENEKELNQQWNQKLQDVQEKQVSQETEIRKVLI